MHIMKVNILTNNDIFRNVILNLVFCVHSEDDNRSKLIKMIKPMTDRKMVCTKADAKTAKAQRQNVSQVEKANPPRHEIVIKQKLFTQLFTN